MMYVLFGCGLYGQRMLNYMNGKNVAYFVDNDPQKRNINADIPIYTFAEKKTELLKGQHELVITVSPKYIESIKTQLADNGINSFCSGDELCRRIIKEKLDNRPDLIDLHLKAINWVKRNTISTKGIINNTDLRLPYPEVSGYFIPSLINWGYRDIALTYAKWLCSIQKADGSWYDCEGKAPYVFDTAQILKGLLAVREILPEADEHIIKGCDWILGNMQPNGRLTAPAKEIWSNEKICSELIHVYCLTPLRDAGTALGIPRYEEAAYKILRYYLDHQQAKILDFSLLSHFYAYVMEGLLDMGATSIVRKAMNNIAKLQKPDGSIPAYKDVHWVCSTGLFQLALVWFKLGDWEHGNKAFIYACKLQNESGGWYGSYIHPDYPHEVNTYFPRSEISWAVKYYFDALSVKHSVGFANGAYRYIPVISRDDDRYKLIYDEVAKMNKNSTICEVGCGKGRYLRNLMEDFPENEYYAVDLYSEIMNLYFHDYNVKKIEGTLTHIPCDDDSFDVLYACESLCHAIDVRAAIKEVFRVVKKGGKVVVIDKSKDSLGTLEIGVYEQWFDVNMLKEMFEEYCSDVKVLRDLKWDNMTKQGLFVAWIGTVK